MSIDFEDKKKIYNDAIRLLELLNVFIPEIEKNDPKFSVDFLQELVEKSYELGVLIATEACHICEDVDEDDKYMNYPEGMM